jgi:Ni,Fe-hydrogenase I cytochrome b subunit
MAENLTQIYLYTRYERFWHWFQAAMIVVLLITGFEVHGLFRLVGFDLAVRVHNFVGIAWLIAFCLLCILGVYHRRVAPVCSHHAKDVRRGALLRVRHIPR